MKQMSFYFGTILIFISVLLIVNYTRAYAYPLPRELIYTYTELEKGLHYLQDNYPKIVTITTIGRSVEEVPLHMINLGKGPRKILIVGSLHAREWINTPLLIEMAKTYASDYYRTKRIDGESIRYLLNTHTFHIIPLANPDGVKLQQFGADAFLERKDSLLKMNNGNTDFTRWKSNVRGVDLNKNWNVQWDEPKVGFTRNNPGRDFYPGVSPESEPEVHSIANWVRANNPVMILDFHSTGEVLFWYYYQQGRILERDRKIVEAMANYSGYAAEGVNKNKAANTTLTRWAVITREIPSVCVENGVYTDTYVDMRDFEYIIDRVRYIIPTAVLNMKDYPSYTFSDVSSYQFPKIR